MEVDAATRDGELSVDVRALRPLKLCVVAGKTRASTAEIQAREALDKIYELRLLLGRLTRTLSREHARVAELVEVALSRVRLVITAALSNC